MKNSYEKTAPLTVSKQ